MVPFKNTAIRYGWGTITFHWVMAVIMIGLIIIGLIMVPLPWGIKKLKLYGWHKEWGILILMLVTARIFWRLYNIQPQLPLTIPFMQRLAAHAMHYVFYGTMILLPLTGWMISSSAGLPISFFGLFTLPDFITPNEHNRILLQLIHEWLSYALIAAILGHTGAALLHHFYYKDDILKRILP